MDEEETNPSVDDHHDAEGRPWERKELSSAPLILVENILRC
jgi:hypothetical protein